MVKSGVGLAKKALRDHKEIPEFTVRRNWHPDQRYGCGRS
jgi:hypothetical protein